MPKVLILFVRNKTPRSTPAPKQYLKPNNLDKVKHRHWSCGKRSLRPIWVINKSVPKDAINRQARKQENIFTWGQNVVQQLKPISFLGIFNNYLL